MCVIVVVLDSVKGDIVQTDELDMACFADLVCLIAFGAVEERMENNDSVIW